MYKRVAEFNEKVVGIVPTNSPFPLMGKEVEWLQGVLCEEADEFADEKEVVGQVDALLDSVIFALGGLFRIGLTEEQVQQCFDAIMDANFEKKAGQKAGRVFEGVKDAVKPEGWVPPEARIEEILKNV